MNNQRTLVFDETKELTVVFDTVGYQDGSLHLEFFFYVNGVNTEHDRYAYKGNGLNQIQKNQDSTYYPRDRYLPFYEFEWYEHLSWAQKDEAREFVAEIIQQMPHCKYTVEDSACFFEEKE